MKKNFFFLALIFFILEKKMMYCMMKNIFEREINNKLHNMLQNTIFP